MLEPAHSDGAEQAHVGHPVGQLPGALHVDEPASFDGETQQTWVLGKQYSDLPASVLPNGQYTSPPSLVGKSFGGDTQPASDVEVSGFVDVSAVDVSGLAESLTEVSGLPESTPGKVAGSPLQAATPSVAAVTTAAEPKIQSTSLRFIDYLYLATNRSIRVRLYNAESSNGTNDDASVTRMNETCASGESCAVTAPPDRATAPPPWMVGSDIVATRRLQCDREPHS